jgi:hypothetical protein
MDRDRSLWTALALAFVVAAALFAVRVSAQPLQPYGSNAAEYIEHAVRLEVSALRQESTSLGDFLFAADETVLTHPPGLHIATLPAQAVLGRTAEGIVWTGLFWHLLLSLALAGCAWGWAGAAASGAGPTTRTSKTRQKDAARAAAVAGLLFPAGLAAATRYHYDLPMTALIWCAAAALIVGRDRWPWRAGLLAGLMLAAASFVKWTALPLGGVVVAGALCTIDRKALRRRAAAGLSTALLWSVPVLLFLSLSLSSFQAGVMAVDGEPADSSSGPLSVPLAFGAKLLRSLIDADLGVLAWYPAATTIALFSPLLTLAVAPLLWSWWRARTLRGFVLIVVLGQWAVLSLGVSVLDERFALTAAPALLVAAAIGWVDHPRRRLLGAVAVVAACLVSVEFHLVDRGVGGTSLPMGSKAPALTVRGPFLGDTVERRGWSSRSTTPSSSPRARAGLVEALARCAPEQLGYIDGLSDQGDTWWLRYRARLDGEPRLVLSHGSIAERRYWWPDPDTDARSHLYDKLGFNLDTIGDPGGFAGLNEVELGLNLRGIGLRPEALDHFGPTVALTRMPPGPDTPLDSTWRLLERIDSTDAEPMALYGRGEAPCPGPEYEAPP